MLTFVRICIEVDATKELPLSIPIKTSSKSYIIDVEYVWKPLLCTECKRLGHETNRCGSQAEIARPRQQAQGWTNAKFKEARKEHLPNKEPMQIGKQAVNDVNFGKNVGQIATKNGGGKEPKENIFVLKRGDKRNVSHGAFELPTKNTFAALQDESEFSIHTMTGMVLESNEGVEGLDTTSSRVKESADQEKEKDVEEGEFETTVSKKKRNQTHLTPESECPPGFEGSSRAKLDLHLIGKENARNTTFVKRKKGLEKKIYEFAALCGVDACMIIYGPNNRNSACMSKLEIWPKNQDEVYRIIDNYKKYEKEK
ncbi:Mads-box transcription factor family protein [Thalictrum thalictroides]|uniref:Mads-box transcription factor family protein n=1 Tax=Thalictrum thalictroides TaxID=46969 RepID=A0A7J6W4Z0_THATH|nr:Mads-box transcription factor family protein [Thalictrum thalictroides]